MVELRAPIKSTTTLCRISKRNCFASTRFLFEFDNLLDAVQTISKIGGKANQQ